MKLDDAREVITRYGRCLYCKHSLKAAESVERMVGPVCAKRFAVLKRKGGVMISITYQYCIRDRVELVSTSDEYTDLRRGDQGVVTGVNHRLGQVFVTWDHGSQLAMLVDEGDCIRLVL